jgi:subtilisin family serine protease
MRISISILALTLGLSVQGRTQEPLQAPTEPVYVPGEYLFQFRERSFDLEAFRAAVYGGRSAAEVADIVAGYERAVIEDQQIFAKAAEAVGARVSHQWWIINGAAVADLSDSGLAALSALPNVLSVERQQMHYPLNNTARNSTHHEADQANQRRNATGALIDGAGVAVAVIDTGVDAQHQGGANPHPSFYLGGSTSNNQSGGLGGSRLMAALGTSGNGGEDQNSHGSHVAGSIASGASGYRGMAPGANIVGIKISGAGTSGGATSSALVSAWQLVAQRRVSDNIRVANNSFSGSPSLTSSIQVALDNTAFNADVLACCAAGNSGANTASSQNVWNGLACGSINKNSLAVSSFSGRGPLDNFGRTYPDITAVGASVRSTQIDGTSSSKSGTSMATPMVAGGSALVRHANANLTALESKAILLHTTKHTQNDRNNYGLGVMDCDAAVQFALTGDFHTLQMNSSNRTENLTFSVPTTQSASLTLSWMHPGGSAYDNVDLRVYNGTQLVASDLNTQNSYEHVDFVAMAGVQYRVEITWVGSAVRPTLDVAVIGIADTPVTPPTLTALAPTVTQNSSRDTITLTGTFDRIDRVDLGSSVVTSFTSVSAAQLQFDLPFPAEIGAAVPVSVSNSAGTSQTLFLQIGGTHPAQVSGSPIGVRTAPFVIGIGSDALWSTIMIASPDNVPSSIPGLLSLDIANNFASMFVVGSATMDALGRGQMGFTFPLGVPLGTYYFQAIAFDPASPSLPLESSNVYSIQLVF